MVQNFYNRLAALDDEVRNYKQSVQLWRMQREGELEDYKKKLQIASAFAPETTYGTKLSVKTITNPLTGESSIVAVNPYTGEVESEVPVGILELPEKEKEEKEEEKVKGLEALLSK